MMGSEESTGHAVIPCDLWMAAEEEQNQKISQKKKNKNKNNNKTFLFPLLHFTFSLHDGRFVNYNIQNVSNLFFHFAAASTYESVSKDYIVVQMDDEEGDEDNDHGAYNEKKQSSSSKGFQSYHVDPLREMLLRQGIRVEGENEQQQQQQTTIWFHFIGCSNSQVQKHCYVFRKAGNVRENERKLLEILPSLHQLEAKSGIPKRVKYTGLLFSGITSVALPDDVQVEEIESKKQGEFDFTDGPGLISYKLALWVAQRLGLTLCPSVFQIRYCGIVQLRNTKSTGYVCKGVLVVDPTNRDTYAIQVRKALLKIEASPHACRVLQGILGICDYSKPTPGRLGQQQVCLLSGTVSRDDFLNLQKETLDRVSMAHHNPRDMAWVLALDKRPQVWKNFHKLLLAEYNTAKQPVKQANEVVPPFYRTCVQMLQKGIPKSNKIQLPLAASRTLFGAVFPEQLHDTLKEGECCVFLENGPLYHGEGDRDRPKYVIVSRSPTYHPGDIRVLRVVSLPEGHTLWQLRNCILFSTQGERPDPDKMGGGDLDGDKYLVIWHPTLLKYINQLRAIKPADYLSPPKGGISDYDWIHYAAMTDNSMLGMVENTFYRLAKKHGVQSAQIEQLNTLFASLVDRHPTSLDAFEKLKNSILSGETTPSGTCIWEDMATMQRDATTATNTSVQQKSLSNHASSRWWLESYRKFHNATTSSCSRQILKKYITEESKHHFRECMLWNEITKTVSAMDRLDAATSGLLKEIVQNPVPEDSSINKISDEDKIADSPEMNEHESDTLSAFECRAYALFKKSIDEMAQEIRPLKTIFDEQMSRKQNIEVKYHEEMVLRGHQRQPLDNENRLPPLETMMEDNRSRRSLRVVEKRIDANRTLAALDAQLREKSADIVRDEAALLTGSNQQLACLEAKLRAELAAVANDEAALRAVFNEEAGGTVVPLIRGIFSTSHREVKDPEEKIDHKDKIQNSIEMRRATIAILRMQILEAKIHDEVEAVARDEAALRVINEELGGTFIRFVAGLFVSPNQETMEREKRIRQDLVRRRATISSLKMEISTPENQEATKRSKERIKSLTRKSLGELEMKITLEQRRVKAELALIQKQAEEEDQLDKYCSDLISGAEKTRLEALIAEEASKVSSLRQSLECADEDDYPDWRDRIDFLVEHAKEYEKAIQQALKYAGMDIQDLYEKEKSLKLDCCSDDDDDNQHLRDRLDVLVEHAKKCKKAVQTMFCPQALEDAEMAIQDLNRKELSLTIGRDHILREVEKAKHSWNAILATKMFALKQRQDKWKELLSNLERIYTIEENRILGFPRKGQRRGPMPVYSKRGELQWHLKSSQALIITAGTGCGKSTQIPQYIADDFFMYREDEASKDSPVRICCTQPRRVAAQKVARTVAEEYLTTLGELVGFRVGSKGRSQQECVKISEKTVIEFLTEGLLLHQLAKSPDFIYRYDAVIIDEMHERNKEQDLCLSLLHDFLIKAKSSHPSFKVVVMSASINAERFSQYFGKCPIMDCPGKNYGVEEHYIPIEASSPDVYSHAVDVLFKEILAGSKETAGDVLIFLAGASDIDACVNEIRARAKGTGDLVVTYPLYSKLDQTSIDAATNPNHRCGLQGEMNVPPKSGSDEMQVRKVIVSTNLAETSLTIDGVRFVIESGRANKMTYDHTLRCAVLSEAYICHASTIQRKGRAGRTASGTCFYLYSEEFHTQEMEKYDKPSILENCVDRLILFSMHVCGKSLEEMALIDTPEMDDIFSARQRLSELGFLEEDGSEGSWVLTNDGKIAAKLSSVRPESIRMMLDGFRKYPHCAKRIMTLAVLMSSEESIFDTRLDMDKEDFCNHVYGDHLLMLEHFEWFDDLARATKKKNLLKKKCTERGLVFRALSSVQEEVEMCHRELKKQKRFPSVAAKVSNVANDDCLLRALISGYFHHVVSCLEPDYATKIPCSHLTIPDVSISLDRNSFLGKILGSKPKESSFFQDDNPSPHKNKSNPAAATHDPSNGNQWTIVSEDIIPCFMLYGNLKKNSKINVTFMLDASAIEGTWLAEEAPKRWIKRVKFDPKPKNICRILIKNVGPQVISECKKRGTSRDADFFEETKEICKVQAVIPSYERCTIVISGTQTTVGKAKEIIKKNLNFVMEQFCQKDQAFNNDIGLSLGIGMVVKGRAQSGNLGKKPFHTIFCAYGTNESDSSPGRNVASFLIDKKNPGLFFVSPAREFSLKVLERALKEVSSEDLSDFSISWKKGKNSDRFIVTCRRKTINRSGEGKSEGSGTAKQVVARLQHHTAFSSIAVDSQCFQNKKERLIFWALSQEAQRRSPFWNEFRLEILAGSPPDATMIFLRSHESTLFGPDDQKLATTLKRRVAKLTNVLEYHESENESQRPFERYQVHRFVSILAELRNRCPKVMFHVLEAKSVDGETESNAEFLSDYEWLLELGKRKTLKSIRLCFSGLVSKDQAQARNLVTEKLSPQALQMGSPASLDVPKSFERKPCVMCRRDVLVSMGKNGKNGTGDLKGWNLSLCGCSYCRECFREGVIQTLKDEVYGCARCMCCKRLVLAKDCFSIIAGPKSSEQKGASVFRAEWDQLCRLAERSYCRKTQSLIVRESTPGRVQGKPQGCATCPDCDLSMVHPRGYRFFFCRNPKCRSKICTTCYQVPTCKADSVRCSVGKCKEQNTEE